MIDYIVYGEFDINEGNVIKVEYPQKTGISEMVLSSYLIPEGTHNIMNDCFCFIINRKMNNEELLVENMKKQMDKLNLNLIKYLDLKSSQHYDLYVKNKVFKLKELYNYNSFAIKWESLNLLKNFSKDDILLKIDQDTKENFFNFIVFDSNNNEVFFSIPIHNDIQFKKLKSNFASIYTLNSQAIGFEFYDENELSTLEKLFESESVEIMTNKNDDLQSINIFSDFNTLLNSEKEIYFLCYLETRLDKSTKRGAILKSISLGSTKLINLHTLKPVAKYILDEIFKIHTLNASEEDKLFFVRKVIESSFKSVNSIPSVYYGVGLTFYEREVNAFLQSNTYFISAEKFYEIDVGNQKLKLDISLPNYEEKIFPGNLTELIRTFKENTMIIYDAILSDKKILFIGDANTSCEKLNNYVFSCVSMVSPACLGILKRIHPYKNLYDLDFLKSSNCIYAVTNPIFKNKTDSWDVMCEIDSGKISLSENYKKYLNSINRESDNFFIRELLFKINVEYINEYEVEKYFKIYTSHLVKITGEQYFSDDEDLTNEINKQYKRKLKLQMSNFWKFECELDKIRQFINFSGRSLQLISRHVNNLYNRKFIEKEECLLIYRDIDKFLTGGEFFVTLV